MEAWSSSSLPKRSKMTKLENMKWLRTRYSNEVNENRHNAHYLNTPEMIAR